MFCSPLHFATGLLVLVRSTRGVVHSVAHVGLVEAVELVPLKQYLKMTSIHDKYTRLVHHKLGMAL